MKARLKVHAKRGNGWLAYYWVAHVERTDGRHMYTVASPSLHTATGAQADGEQWCRDRGLEIEEAQGA